MTTSGEPLLSLKVVASVVEAARTGRFAVYAVRCASRAGAVPHATEH
jgi:hypothetical protein